jgi:hypothetical protein
MGAGKRELNSTVPFYFSFLHNQKLLQTDFSVFPNLHVYFFLGLFFGPENGDAFPPKLWLPRSGLNDSIFQVMVLFDYLVCLCLRRSSSWFRNISDISVKFSGHCRVFPGNERNN